MELLKKTTGFHLVKYDSTRSLFVAKEHSVGQSNEQEHLKNREVRMRKLLPKNNPNWVDALQLLKSENKLLVKFNDHKETEHTGYQQYECLIDPTLYALLQQDHHWHNVSFDTSKQVFVAKEQSSDR